VKRRLQLVAAASAVLWLANAAFERWCTHQISAVQRGWQVAHDKGCFTCHGPGGIRGMPNPGHGLGDVPAFSDGLLSMYAQNEAEIAEWIMDGMPARLRADPQQQTLRARAVVRMPAFRDVLTGAELSYLVAYVKAVSDFDRPDDEGAEAGRQIALRVGCFSCHGPQGRGSMPNVRAFKGYIPAWDGDDFRDLARDDIEVRQWILDGGTTRLYANPAVRWFLERQPIKMPSYRGHLRESEVERLIDYIKWLRSPRGIVDVDDSPAVR
jgi:mono/diheme cytochrome c family protein